MARQKKWTLDWWDQPSLGEFLGSRVGRGSGSAVRADAPDNQRVKPTPAVQGGIAE